MKKVMKKWLVGLLSFAMLVNGVFLYNNVAEAQSSEESTNEVDCVNADGELLEIVATREGDSVYDVEIENETSGEKVHIDFENGILVVTYYEEILDVFGKKLYQKVSIEEYDYSDYAVEEYVASAYSSKVKCVVPTAAGNQLWYKTGQSGGDVGYSQIGCKASYRIENSAPYLTDFKNSVKDSNTSLAKSGVTSAGTIVACVAAISAAGALTGPAGAALVATITGLNLTTAGYLFDAINNEMRAHEYYDTTKAYGKKL